MDAADFQYLFGLGAVAVALAFICGWPWGLLAVGVGFVVSALIGDLW